MNRSPLLSPRAWTIAGFVLLAIGHVAVLADHLSHAERFYGHPVPHSVAILHYCYAVSVFGLVPIGWCLLRLRRAGRAAFADVRSWLPVRLWIYCVFLAIAITSAAAALNLFGISQFLTRSFFESTLVGFLDLWALFILAFLNRSPETTGRAWRYADVTLMNVVVTLLLAEGMLTLWAHFAKTHLPIDPPSIEANVAWHRQEPYSRYFNFTLNSGGYHDTEFFRASDEDFVVALLSDSFGIGVVPYAYNFATIAERQLQAALGEQYKRVAVHNFGIPAINMPEYAYLLHTEVLHTNPTHVVLCVFVGNDIHTAGVKKFRHYVFQYWRLWTLTTRLVALQEEKRKGGHALKIGEPVGGDDAVPAYIHDPEDEPPTFSEEAFLKVESKRMEIVNPQRLSTQKKYRRFFDALAQFHSWLGDKLIVVVIPDEFQVNDELYERLLATKPNATAYQRYYSLERLRAFCRERGIAMLDLLPALRVANKEARVYHLRDTHWNARGNRVAGQAIAEFIFTYHKTAGAIRQDS
ncbi:MAG: hypothetical protein ACE5NC_07045 [Anaerolineae bacterium]